jgi:predicted DNA-binding protein with PD1-like motif
VGALNQGANMRCKQIAGNPETFAIIMQTDDEIVAELKGLASSRKFGGSSFKAIGALSHAQLGWFNWETKKSRNLD